MSQRSGPNGETWVDDANQPMEVYLEGNVVVRQDQQKFAGKGDQKTIRRPRLYYDFLTERMVAPNAEMDLFAPSLLAPIKMKSPRIEQFRRPTLLPNGTYVLAEEPEIRAEPGDHDRQPVSRPGLSVHQLVNRPDEAHPAAHRSQYRQGSQEAQEARESPTIPISPRTPTTQSEPRKRSSGRSMPARTSTSPGRSRSFTGRESPWISTTSSLPCA